STSVDGFTFTDNMTTFALGQTFNVHLGAFDIFGSFPPAQIFFDNMVRGPDHTGENLLIGHINMPIWYEGQFGSAIGVGPGYFYVDPVQPSGVSEPASYALLIVGLAGLIARRRRQGCPARQRSRLQ